MIISHLLNKSSAELDAMTDAQILEYFGPVLVFVRPNTDITEVKASVSKVTFKKKDDPELLRKINAFLNYKE